MTPLLHTARALVCAVAVLSLAASPWVGAEEHAASPVPVVSLDGRGHGHGVGLSQWGAYTMARDGASAQQILAQFYPGTDLGHADGEVIVVVDTRDRVRLRFPGGGELRSSRGGAQHDGFPVRVASGGVVDIVRDSAGYRVVGGEVGTLDGGSRQQFASDDECVLLCEDDEPEPEEPAPEDPDPGGCVVCTTTTTAPPDDGGDDEPAPTPTPTPTPTTAPPETTAPPPESSEPAAGEPVSPTPVWAVPDPGSLLQSVDRGRTYRGLFEVVGPEGALRLRNHVDVESYLSGMAEVPGTWPAAAVQAQSIAARTYALRAMAGRGEICDSERCQVYVGTAKETAGQIAAVEATKGVVVTYGGRLAATFYSASGGGVSANVHEGFGSLFDIPYLQPRPYDTDNPKLWAVDIALADVAERLGYPATLTGVRVTATGPSGRPLRIVLEGDAGPANVDPQDFRRKLGLQSTFFTASNATAAEPPPPPPPPESDQLAEDADFGESQLELVVPATERAEAGMDTDSGELAVPSEGTTGAGTAVPFSATVVVAAMAGAVTVRRLSLTGGAVVADGLGLAPYGAPTVLPRIAPAETIAANMARWTSRFR